MVVDELVLQELTDGLGEGSKAEAVWKPDDVDREHLAKNVTKALKSAHPEVATTVCGGLAGPRIVRRRKKITA